ncbi:MAG: hypothetical protein HY225_00785 [Candidatus Vogelbacteria bacterium]|nr:hypothetical protein [Candidatus Vogelbacteria bacterium]
MTQYAYLIGDLFFALVWLILFSHRKDLRKEMLTMSLIISPLGISEIIYYKDYWRPEFIINTGFNFGIEDLLFCFAIGGITAVIYEEVFDKTYSQRRDSRRPKHLLAIAASIILFIFIGNSLLGVNSIYVTSAVMLLAGLAIIFIRHDLIKEAMMSGLLIGLAMFLFYTLYFLLLFPGIIQKWWLLKNLSGILLFGVPIEEILWGFCWGFIAGPIYEFILGIKLKNK